MSVNRQLEAIRDYWNAYADGLAVPGAARGTTEFFNEIKVLHDKAYARANELLGFDTLGGQKLLEIAPGVGLDTVEFAKHGADVTAVDIAPSCVDLARKSVACRGLEARIDVGDVENLEFPDGFFDVIVARGVFMYTPDDRKLLDEILRVTKPGGRIQILLHNRNSWYVTLARMSGANLFAQSGDPPVNRLYSLKEVDEIAARFSSCELHYDRYPSRQSSRSGVSAWLFDFVFVPLFGLIPRRLVRSWGFYMLLQARR